MNLDRDEAATLALSATSEAVLSWASIHSESVITIPSVLRIRNARKGNLRIRKVTGISMECQAHAVVKKATKRRTREKRPRGEITRFGVQLDKWLRGKPDLWLVKKTEGEPPDLRVLASNLTKWKYAQPKRDADGKYEAGVYQVREPGVFAVAAVARALDITVDAFLFGDPGDTINLAATEEEVRVVFAYRDKRHAEFKAKVDQLMKEREAGLWEAS